MSTADSMINQTAEISPTFLGYKIVDLSKEGKSGVRKIAQHIHKELPIRISHRIVELQNLPYNLSDTNSILKLTDYYKSSFYNFKHLPYPDDDENEKRLEIAINDHFIKLKEAIYLISQGLNECVEHDKKKKDLIQSCPFLNAFLDKFHSARISTRFLTGHYIELRKQLEKNIDLTKTTRVGLVDFNLCVKTILESATNDAEVLCEKNYSVAPEVVIQDEQNIHMTYVASHLYYTLFEVIKNSMRATCEINKDDIDNLPSINVVIVGNDSSNQVTIKISDEGGGISSNDMKKIWYYSFSTVKDNKIDGADSSWQDVQDAPMAGFGYGLPLARLYARSLPHGLTGYSGGDLDIISMEGYGTDAFVFLDWIKPQI